MKTFFSFVLALGFLFVSPGCGGDTQKKKDNGFSYEQPVKDNNIAVDTTDDTDKPSERIDQNSKGIGPVKNLTLDNNLDLEMTRKGELLYSTKCVACHQVENNMLGPKMQGITERRSPEWIMNIMLNPQEMLMKDPLAKELLAEYKNAVMVNQNLSEADARAILEYLRTLR
ncbi:c-type cytochrome [Robertkochia flava]|uniref:c-type cytochrome n=1 Tax=Robertkochia flava TaxID=3447986 RepID=UPI001CCEED28|nr:cytochrome c [Robertkochia marina]